MADLIEIDIEDGEADYESQATSLEQDFYKCTGTLSGQLCANNPKSDDIECELDELGLNFNEEEKEFKFDFKFQDNLSDDSS